MDFSNLLFLIGLTFFMIYLFLKWLQNYWTRKGIPQLNPSILFGDIKPMALDKKSQADFFRDLYQKCKEFNYKEVGIYTGLVPVYIPLDHNLIQRILVKDFDYFGGRGMYQHEQDFPTTSLFFVGGKKWKNRRTKLTFLFTTGKLKKMLDTVVANGQELNKVIAECEKLNQKINIKDVLARYTTDNTASLVFGLEYHTLREPENELRALGKELFRPDLVKRLVEIMFPVDLLAKLGYRMFPSRVYTFFPQLIQAAIEYREKTGYEKSDFLQLMLQLKKYGKLSEDNGANSLVDPALSSYMDNAEIISESLLMYGAGFETSSSASTFAMYELAHNQQIQDKLRNEITSIIEKEKGNITYDVITSMEYLDKVVKESLRKYPPLPVITRECLHDYKFENSNKTIEKGTKLIIPIIGLHRDPDYYPNPDEFNPENFSYEKESLRPNGVYMPFGDGPRHCLAARLGLMQTKVALVFLLKDFRFTLDESVNYTEPLDAGVFIMAFKGDTLLKATRLRT